MKGGTSKRSATFLHQGGGCRIVAELTRSIRLGRLSRKTKTNRAVRTMITKYLPLLAVVGLAACSGNPLNFGGLPPPEPPPPAGEIGEEAPITGVEVPAVVANHLRGATYLPGSPVMQIDLRTMDGTPLNATYARDPSLDVAGYDAYTIQETASQRKFVALFRRSGTVEAGAVADGGQFINYFGGATFRQVQPFTLPAAPGPGDTLLATYTGGYIGLLNFGPPQNHPGPPFDPAQSARVQGEVMLNADFNASNMSVAGGIRNRSIVDDGTPLQDVFFWVTEINPNGAFSGTIRFTPQKTIGNYAGVFGAGGADVAGATILRPIDGDNTTREHGAFAIPRCAVGDPPPCP